LNPTLDKLANDYAGKLLFAKVDTGSEPEMLKRFDIANLPGLVFVNNGRAQATAYGNVSESALRSWCDYLVTGGTRPSVPNGPSISLSPGSAARPNGASAPAPGTSAPKGNGKPITLTDANFTQVINGDLPVLVDFWAPWCGPCRMVAPAVESLAQEYDGKLVVGKLNVDDNQMTASRYGIMSIPALFIFKNGQVVDQMVGAQPANIIRQRVFPYVR
jgi:thioredoxin 1